MPARKHALDELEELAERRSKRSKVESNVFYQAVSDRVGGNPTKSGVQRLRLTSLLGICHDFGLLDNGSRGTPTKGQCVKRILMHLHDQQLHLNQPESSDEIMGPYTTEATFRICLYKKPSDYETRYVEEVEAPQSPCGGLDLHDLSKLFKTKGTFDVIECKRYRPIIINGQNRIVPRDVLDILLQDFHYIRVVCTT